eukprot:NODE_3534_length_773_cov_278.782730.p2 GENE.NODE_3534_length_773_cov_278.782730~~NODE_3534_length_773_cov_278.782730.p2  ORF type:complete len:225 (+),score=56.45 NODE_3534_length_773_cov_278.782730:40-675(+)
MGFSLCTSKHDTANMPESIAVVDTVETFVHACAFIAGLKGLIGIMFRDPKRIRMLLIYHIVEVVTSGIVVVFRVAGACEELDRLRQPQAERNLRISCSSVRLALAGEFVLHFCFFSYCIFIIWSLMTRMEAGEFGRGLSLFGSEGLFDRTDVNASWLFLPTHEANAAQQYVPLGVPVLAVAPPFSGEPRTLAGPTEPCTVDHFRGMPRRLD